MLLLAACGGHVEGQGAEDEETGGSGGDTSMPMPTGAGSGGSYDPGTGGTGGTTGTGGTGAQETGGTGGWDPGMPTGAGAGGSYEPDPEPDGGVGGDYDAGPSGVDAAFEPDAGPEPDGGLMDDPCIQACEQNNPAGWKALFVSLAPCVCAAGYCDAECADSLCGDNGAAMPNECGSCALVVSQSECMPVIAECAQEPTCSSAIVCLLGCN
jgi:hypothetical protein